MQHAQGYELTPSGQALLKHAEAMENVALLAQEEITQAITPLGKIRLGVTEGIGIMFFTPRMNALFERYPGLEVELVAVPRFVSILNREAEISIHLERPNADLLITRKLTDYRLALYASQGYLDQAPPLRNREDLARHNWIGYVDDLLFSQELLFLNSFCRAPTVVFRSTSVIAQQAAARAGWASPYCPTTWLTTTRRWCAYCLARPSSAATGSAPAASCTSQCACGWCGTTCWRCARQNRTRC